MSDYSDYVQDELTKAVARIAKEPDKFHRIQWVDKDCKLSMALIYEPPGYKKPVVCGN